MSYIDKCLMEGEHIVYQPQLHAIIYMKAIVLATLGVLVWAIPLEENKFFVQLGMSVLLIVAAIYDAVTNHGGRQYVLTNKRLIAKEGIIALHSLELMLRKCEGVAISQSIWGRMFNYGTILVTTGEVINRFAHIKDPITFSTRINQVIDMLKSNE